MSDDCTLPPACVCVPAQLPNHVSPVVRDGFLRKLTLLWLPGKEFRLLYRGSEDGMHAKAFHLGCDGMGPTLTLVQSKNGFVFGGYASVSWDSVGGYTRAPGSFMFSVIGPYGAVTHFPAMEGWEGTAIYRGAEYGPHFPGGMAVRCDATLGPEGVFDQESYCAIAAGKEYEDVLGRGKASLTGTEYWTPVEVEVFEVVGLARGLSSTCTCM